MKKKGKMMNASSTVAWVVGGVAVLGIAAYAVSAKADTPKRKRRGRRRGAKASAEAPARETSAPEAPEAEAPAVVPAPARPQPPAPSDTVRGRAVRRSVMPDPREASWSELEDTVALLSPDAQWRFAVPEARAGAFPEGQVVLMRMDTVNGIATSETTATSVGFTMISRLGPSISFNRESGILQIYAGGYVGRIEIEAGDLSLSAWVLSEDALETVGPDGRSKHLVDRRVDGVWQVHAFVVDETGAAIAHDFAEFLAQDAAMAWADAQLEGLRDEASEAA